MELRYVDDLVLIAETKELLLEVRKLKEGMENKGPRVNAGKTKIMWCLHALKTHLFTIHNPSKD